MINWTKPTETGRFWVLAHDEDFVYFYYYLGLYPLTTASMSLTYSDDGALQEVDEHGSRLMTESHIAVRYGELGQMYLYLPYAFARGSPQFLSVVPTHGSVFTVALMLLFFFFWHSRHTLFGALIVTFAGSNPYQLYEVYRSENVFGWTISTLLIVLAIHLPLIFQRRTPAWYVWLLPLATSVLLATVRQFRTEPILVLLSAACVYALAARLTRLVRFGQIALLIVVFTAVCSVAAEDMQTLRKQAEAGDAYAQFGLGVRYANGEGVPKDAADQTRLPEGGVMMGWVRLEFPDP